MQLPMSTSGPNQHKSGEVRFSNLARKLPLSDRYSRGSQAASLDRSGPSGYPSPDDAILIRAADNRNNRFTGCHPGDSLLGIAFRLQDTVHRQLGRLCSWRSELLFAMLLFPVGRRRVPIDVTPG